MQGMKYLELDSSKLYKIQTYNNKSLRVRNHGCDTGDKLEVGEMNKIQNNCLYQFEQQKFGYYTIRPFHSNLVLEIDDKSIKTNALIIQNTENQATNQQFRFEIVRNDFVLIRARNSTLVWSVKDIKLETGSLIIQEYEHCGNNQIFKIQEVNDIQTFKYQKS